MKDSNDSTKSSDFKIYIMDCHENPADFLAMTTFLLRPCEGNARSNPFLKTAELQMILMIFRIKAKMWIVPRGYASRNDDSAESTKKQNDSNALLWIATT